MGAGEGFFRKLNALVGLHDGFGFFESGCQDERRHVQTGNRSSLADEFLRKLCGLQIEPGGFCTVKCLC